MENFYVLIAKLPYGCESLLVSAHPGPLNSCVLLLSVYTDKQFVHFITLSNKWLQSFEYAHTIGQGGVNKRCDSNVTYDVTGDIKLRYNVAV